MCSIKWCHFQRPWVTPQGSDILQRQVRENGTIYTVPVLIRADWPEVVWSIEFCHFHSSWVTPIGRFQRHTGMLSCFWNLIDDYNFDLWLSIFWFYAGGGTGFFDLGESNFGEGLGDRSPPPGSRVRAPVGGLAAKPQKLKKHCKLYTFEKYFVWVCHTWCQREHTDNVVLHKSIYKM